MNFVRYWRAALRSNRYTKVLAFFSAVALVIVFTTMFYGVEQQRWAWHANRVKEHLYALLADVSECGVAARGVVIAGLPDDDSRRLYDDAKGRCGGHVETARALVADNPAQQVRLDAVAVDLAGKFRELEALMRLAETGRRSDAVVRFREGRSVAVHERIKDSIRVVIAEEDRLAYSRWASAAGSFAGCVALLVLVVVMTCWVWGLFRDELRLLDGAGMPVIVDVRPPPLPVPMNVTRRGTGDTPPYQ